MGKFVARVVKTETMALSEQTDGFWLWDETRQMNLSMRAKSPIDAFIESLIYYQKRLSEVERDHSNLSAKVDAFVSQFQEEDHA